MDDGVNGLLLAVVLGALYFLPTIVAVARKHTQAGAIFLLNLLLGWTVVGWVGAIVWSVVRNRAALAPVGPPTVSAPSSRVNAVTAELERLNALYKSGALTAAEFSIAKTRLLKGG